MLSPIDFYFPYAIPVASLQFPVCRKGTNFSFPSTFSGGEEVEGRGLRGERGEEERGRGERRRGRREGQGLGGRKREEGDRGMQERDSDGGKRRKNGRSKGR